MIWGAKNRVVVVGSTYNHVDVQLKFVEQCDITQSFRSDRLRSRGVSLLNNPFWSHYSCPSLDLHGRCTRQFNAVNSGRRRFICFRCRKFLVCHCYATHLVLCMRPDCIADASIIRCCTQAIMANYSDELFSSITSRNAEALGILNACVYCMCILHVALPSLNADSDSLNHQLCN